MTKEDFDDAFQICELYKKLYYSDSGFVAAGNKIQLNFKGFIDFFKDYKIIKRDGGSYGWELEANYGGMKVFTLADYDEMMVCPQTKQYLKEKM